MAIIQGIPKHFVDNKQKRKISLLLNAYIEIPVSCLKTNKLTNQPTREQVWWKAHTNSFAFLLSWQ